MLIQIFKARKINSVLGGAAVMPWEVNEWPKEWIDAICSLVDDLPGMEEMERARQKYMTDWQARRKNNGKRTINP